MLKRRWAGFVVAGVFIFAWAWVAVRDNARVVAATSDPPTIAYVYQGNIYAAMFKEPYEILYFLMDDGEFFGFTTQEDSWVRGTPSLVIQYLEKAGYKIGDIGMCIHNHFGPAAFSMEDRKFYYFLKSQGFVGAYGIFYTATGKCRWWDEGGDK